MSVVTAISDTVTHGRRGPTWCNQACMWSWGRGDVGKVGPCMGCRDNGTKAINSSPPLVIPVHHGRNCSPHSFASGARVLKEKRLERVGGEGWLKRCMRVSMRVYLSRPLRAGSDSS